MIFDVYKQSHLEQYDWISHQENYKPCDDAVWNKKEQRWEIEIRSLAGLIEFVAQNGDVRIYQHSTASTPEIKILDKE